MMDDNALAERAETLREETDDLGSLIHREGEFWPKQWLLLGGRRVVVSATLLAVVFVVFISLALARPVDMRRLLTETSTLQTLFSALLSGAILLVSIVVSISSVVLSQEITDIDTKRERIDATIEFRRRTEELIENDISPVRPAAFLRVILHTIHDETMRLRELAAEGDDRSFREQVDAVTEGIVEDTVDAGQRLHGARFGTFKVLSAGLNYNYSWQLNAIRRLKLRHRDRLTETEIEAIDDLIDTLKFFATGREYFQSLYYKREMARLSSVLLYVSLPVIVFISYLLVALDANIIPEVSFNQLSALSVFIIFAYTVSIAPYVVLTAYVIRIATVSIRTLAAGPFILQKRETAHTVEWDVDHDDDWDFDATAADELDAAADVDLEKDPAADDVLEREDS